jgi:hypothetical protein
LAEQAWQRDERYCAPETTRCGPVLTLADCGGFLLREYLRTGATRPVSAAVSALSERFGAMLSHVPQPHSFHSAASCRYSGISRRSRLAGAKQAAIAAKAPNDQTRLSLRLVDAIGNLPGGSTPLSPNY